MVIVMVDSRSHMSIEATLEPYWSRNRIELGSWLRRNAPSLAELYEGSVRLVYGPRIPGRVHLVSHAVREIRNRLPDAVSGIRAPGSVQYVNRMDEISKQWKDVGLSLDGSVPTSLTTTEADSSSEQYVKLPLNLIGPIARLVRDHELGREKPLDAAKRLFETCAQENASNIDSIRPVILQWIEVTNWFMKRAHDSGRVDADSGEADLEHRFELFEVSLSSLVGSFFEALGGLDEILEDANS